jgi:ankyrin repeat protein
MVDIHPRGLGSGTRLLLAQVAITGDAVNPRHNLSSHAWSDRDVSVALNGACKHGQFETARLLAAWCSEFIVNEAEPCPLHLSEVADILLSHDAAFVGGAFEEEHCSLHTIGQYRPPLLRYIIHGDSSREALRDTIHLLTRRRKCPIDMPDPNGYTALLRCPQDPEHEFHPLDELLLADARGGLYLHDKTNAAMIIARSGSTYTSSLQRLGPLIRDINAVDSLGCNALHYCAFNGNKPLTEVLLHIEGIDVNAQASNGDTALYLVATHAIHGSGHVITLLLASNADFTTADGQEWSALELSAFNRRLTLALMLIEAGASISFL